MKLSFKKAADILLIAFALFLLLFSFDVFFEDVPLTEKLIGFFMHNIPVLLIIMLYLIAQKNTVLASVISVTFFVLFTVFFRTYQDIVVFMMVSFPLLLVGVLYYLDNRVVRGD